MDGTARGQVQDDRVPRAEYLIELFLQAGDNPPLAEVVVHDEQAARFEALGTSANACVVNR